MEEQDFLAAVARTKMTADNREAARLVLVEGLSQVQVVDMTGKTKQRISAIVGTVERAHADMVAERAASVSEVDALSASFALCVKGARDALGDGAIVRPAGEDGKYVGQVVAKTSLHIAQETGRGTVVIHDLAKLDTVPALHQAVSIELRKGFGQVQTLQKERGGLER